MEIEILNFLDEIKEKTSIEFSVYNLSGDCLYGREMPISIGDLGVGKIYSNHKINATVFPLKLKNKNLVGLIEGVGRVELNYATFITELSKKTLFNELTQNKNDFCLALLKGELNFNQIITGAKNYSIKNKECCAMLVKHPKGYEFEVMNTLLNYGSSKADFAVELGDNRLAFVKFSDDVVGEYHSYSQFAECVAQSVLQEYGADVHISLGEPVKNIVDLCQSFSQAVTTQRIVEEEGAIGKVHSFKEYALVKILEDIPKHKLNEYAELLMNEETKEIFGDREMMETAETFLECNLNQSETSRILFLHRNTLNYRLDKIEKITGLNIRKFADAVTFRLITALFKLKR